MKPSDIRWIAHKQCVKAVKASYSAIIVALDQTCQEHKALGLKEALSYSISNVYS